MGAESWSTGSVRSAMLMPERRLVMLSLTFRNGSLMVQWPARSQVP